ncbi:hypothetical protein HYFRA_00005096 [Hymenoscyphus fraxineus]|uniref:Cohesin loading factor n=1 Tax=Hymenoscyphus fraxineus TaxID=746836 RepID=A0A9N9L9R0_9HELO|nr:hypothetical protein HYFRA_00005096 [Hymenoscyphus fraxineus]
MFIQPSQIFQPLPPAHLGQPNPSPRNYAPNSMYINPGAMSSPAPDRQQDTSKLLISLAEEYFDAAHELGPSVSVLLTPTHVEAYQRLIATGLKCLDAALKRGKLPPRMEANVRLRYAGVLHEETENTLEAETALSKGISLCERNKYNDLKYAMQYLLAQVMAQKNPKAAMKALNGYVNEAEDYQHISWVYALRFLRAQYAMTTGILADDHYAIKNFQKISELATTQQDDAIHLTASLMEAMAHMRSAAPDSMVLAQGALGAARKHQLTVGATILQLNGLTHLLDVMCSIREGSIQEMLVKLKNLQVTMDQVLHNEKWGRSSDVIAIPINRTAKSSHTVSYETRAVLGIGEDGRDNLMFSFLSKTDAYSISYLLCGVVLLHRGDQKGVKYLKEGLNTLKGATRTSRMTEGLLPEMAQKQAWRGEIMCYYQLYMAFYAAGISDWHQVKLNIDQLRSTARNFDFALPGPLECLALFLTGVYYQGSGDLSTALRIFQDPMFSLNHNHGKTTSTSKIEREFSIIAALSALWILQTPSLQNTANNTATLAMLEPICDKHPNLDIQTAFRLVKATILTNPPVPLYSIKTLLGAALSGAKKTQNNQFICIILNVMCSKFFSNVVGEQAEKSAMAGCVQAQKSGSLLWRSVADGMLAKCYDVQGKKGQAAQRMAMAEKFALDASGVSSPANGSNVQSAG